MDLSAGRLYGGISRIIGLLSPFMTHWLKIHAKTNAPPVPSAYSASMMPAWAQAPTCPTGNKTAMSSEYTGNRAEQEASGAMRMVINLSLGLSMVRAAMTPGTAQA